MKWMAFHVDHTTVNIDGKLVETEKATVPFLTNALHL
jgi:hypothetical protein